MKEHIVEVTFDVPITDILLLQTVQTSYWVRLDDRTVIMLKNEWLATLDDLQPHTAKDIDYDLAV